MQPEIQYCTTKDGVGIAYEVRGRGPCIVSVGQTSVSALSEPAPGPRLEELARAVQATLEDLTLVRYDGRGSGLSQREPADFSLEARLLDLEAVIERTQHPSFALWGTLSGGLTAIAYAARHPDRLTGLILSNAYASGARFYQESPVGRFIAALQDVAVEQWESVTLAWANRAFESPEMAAHAAAMFRASMTPEAAIQLRAAIRQIDVTPLLKDVAAPTLVLHQRSPLLNLGFSQELASAIPGARIVVTDPPFPLGLGDAEVRAIKAFLGVASDTASSPAAEPAQAIPSGTAIILFADIADSTALTERLGDAAFREKARELDGALRKAIGEAGGTAVEGKLLGDGVLATFSSAREAIECASACHGAGSHAGLPLHVGIHAGDVIHEDNNVFGGAVNIASRVAGEARAGETLVSGTVRDLARTSAGVSFEDRGERELKGVGEPVRLYEVRWREE